MTHDPASTANRLLGYPADARLLLVNADDFGMYPGINAAVVEGFARGIVRSASLMMPCPGAAEAVRLLADHPAVRAGVHLSVLNDISGLRWGPLTPREQVPSLLDKDGHLFMEGQRAEMLARATLPDLETEFRAQIAAALAAGVRPTHFDWHCLYDGGRDDIFALTLGLAREFGVALRVWSPTAIERVRALGLPASDHGMLDSFNLPLAGKADAYADLLRALSPGLTEWAVHPGHDDPASRALDPNGWPVRASDLAFLVSPAAREIVAQEGIVLVGYDALQPAWRDA
jgi:hypothetical protein